MHIPTTTYRIQFSPSFTFKDAEKTAIYLKELGVSDIYASPITKARKGSEHGYDVVDPVRINPELGEEKGFDKLTKELDKLDIGWILDIVPNHMAFDSDNNMLMDVLENGPNSPYYNFFDIDWDHPYERVRGKILTPFLGKFYGDCLESGELKLKFEKDGLFVTYYDWKFPLNLDSYAIFFSHQLNRLKQKIDTGHPDYIKFLAVLYALKNLQGIESRKERYEQIRFVKSMLWELYGGSPDIRKFIEGNLIQFNGKVGEPESFNLLENLLSGQYFRLAFWKVGTEEINYRRFFTVNELISLNMDLEEVFLNTHELIFRLSNQHKINGLRIDHVDGLFDPTRYLARLRKRLPNTYIAAEKILKFGEELPEFWNIQGTTGYDFMNYVNGLYCRRENETKMDNVYYRFIETRMPESTLVHEKKRLIIGKHMAGDVDNLARILARISGRHRYGSDFTLYGLKRALVEVLAWFPVYRTYIKQSQCRETDANYIRIAIEKSRKIMPDFTHELDFIQKILLLEFSLPLNEDEKSDWLQFVMRFQQITGSLMAKGLEDTVLYIYNRMLSLNEVGGNPFKFGVSDIEFHYFNKKKAASWPHSMNATATHDTKRGEDVRARLNVLSEIPDEWEKRVNQWSKLNQSLKIVLEQNTVPDANDEYFLYQTLVGTFPFDIEDFDRYKKRIREYLVKSVREAKIHTAWLKPDQDYEKGFIEFADAILQQEENNTFLKDFQIFLRKIAHFGILNSLSQILIKFTAPGVPDMYQGTELWDFSLVDPDNRRPVDYEQRLLFIGGIKKRINENILSLLKELINQKNDGRIKLFLIRQLAEFRKSAPLLFQEGSYIPLEIGGRHRNSLVAFARNFKNQWSITLAPRFLTEVIAEEEMPFGDKVWSDTYVKLPVNINEWQDVITQRRFSGEKELYLGKILQYFPGALLAGEESE